MNVRKIKKEIGLHSDFKIYLFGSFINNEQYNDIDLLILYNSQSILINDILKLRLQLVDYFKKQFDITLDICLLSYEENRLTDFIAKVENLIKLEQEE